MAHSNDVRPVMQLRPAAGTGYTCVTTENRRNDPDRLVLLTDDPRVRRHVEIREDPKSMAKTSKRMRDQQRRVVVARHAERRAELKHVIASPQSSHQERGEALSELQRQPRDASATRLRNRDAVDGRPRGYVRKAGVSRVRFRELAHAGQLPGITKSSW